VDYLIFMNSAELRRFLANQGRTFETHKGGSGHVTIRRGDRKSQLPMHGSRKELGKGLVNKILKDLGLK
jgi:mRNA interferase HicA